MAFPHQDRGIVRRAVHFFVYGLCSAYLGITPPTEEKEVGFLAALIGVAIIIAIVMSLFGLFLMKIIFKY